MDVTKEFTATIVVGLEGYALLDIKEALSSESIYQGSDVEPNMVISDIRDVSIQDWITGIGDVPSVVGVYIYKGIGRFNEDGVDYVGKFEAEKCLNL